MPKKRREHIFIDNVEHKYCSRCDKYLVLPEFNKNNTKWDKLNPLCSICLNHKRRNLYLNPENKSRNKERCKQYEIKNKERRRLYNKTHYEKYKEENIAEIMTYDLYRRSKKRNAIPKWFNEEHYNQILSLFEELKILNENGRKFKVTFIQEVKDKYLTSLLVPWNLHIVPIQKDNNEIKKIRNRYYSRNKEKLCNRSKNWQKRNPNIMREIRSRRRASKLKAVPPWVSKEHKCQIRDIYKQCAKLTKQTGIQHHVDHIIPLQSNLVCGLHVPWNLQILTAEENMKKHNKLLDEYVKISDNTSDKCTSLLTSDKYVQQLEKIL